MRVRFTALPFKKRAVEKWFNSNSMKMWQVYFWVFPSGGEEEGEAESRPSPLVQSHVTRSLWLDLAESRVTGHTQPKAMLEQGCSQRYTAVSEKLEMITRVLGQLVHCLTGTCLKTRLPIISVIFWENTRQRSRSCAVFLAHALPTLKQAGFPLNIGMLCQTNRMSVWYWIRFNTAAELF